VAARGHQDVVVDGVMAGADDRGGVDANVAANPAPATVENRG